MGPKKKGKKGKKGDKNATETPIDEVEPKDPEELLQEEYVFYFIIDMLYSTYYYIFVIVFSNDIS